MKKFSIIIPVYNVEEYINECLDSVKRQTFKDYEVIVVNDGTKDNSMDIVKNYNVKIINQENQGLSAARNNGAKQAKGEYILFLDSDDYIDKDLLEELDKASIDKPDMIRFQIRATYKDKPSIDFNEESFDTLKGDKAFEIICKYKNVENAWAYAIKREYFEKEKYQFAVGAIHEDFGLTPLMIMKADKVKSISYIGYNYRQRENSIMSNNNYDKVLKKVNDFLNHYRFLIKEIDKTNLDSKVFKSFISNSLILKITELNKDDYKDYLKVLKQEKVFDNILTDSLPRKIKKILLQISPRLFYRR